MRASVLLWSKRARLPHQTPSPSSSPPPSTASTSSPSSVESPIVAQAEQTKEQSILLFFCDKQWQARMMAMAAGVQLLLGAAYTNSLYLVKKRLAEQEEFLQAKEGFQAAVHASPLDFMTTTDWTLCSIVWSAPLLLLVAANFSTARWIHSLTLLPRSQVQVVSYSVLGFLRSRVLPTSSIMRGNNSRLFVESKTYVLPDQGTLYEKEVFERVFRKRT